MKTPGDTGGQAAAAREPGGPATATTTGSGRAGWVINRRARLVVALLLLACVVLLEWWSKLDYSLGILYLFGIVVAATVMSRLQVVALAVCCAFVRGTFFFSSGLSPIEFWLRFAMAVFAYAGIGLLIVEMSRGRRAIQAAYTHLQLEQRLRSDAEHRLAMLVGSSPAGIVTLNGRAEVIAANRAAHTLLGYPLPDGLIGQNVSEQLPIFAGALALSQPLRTASASWARPAGGPAIPVATWFSTYRDGEARFLAGILVDMSEEVRDRERESFRQISDYNRLFAGAVSHEIRNLCSALRVVTANLEARTGLQSDADFRAVTTLVESLASIASFRLDSTRRPDIATISLHAVLEQLRVVIEPDWSDIDAQLDWQLGEPDVQVQADPHGLLQTFLNLTQNALRAVQDPGCTAPRLTVTVTPEPARVTVGFVDSGPGIADPATLFQPFRPGAASSGLGLFIARTLVRSFDGEVSFVPTDRGCRFDVMLLRGPHEPGPPAGAPP